MKCKEILLGNAKVNGDNDIYDIVTSNTVVMQRSREGTCVAW
jgi:hypothetical protein